MGHASKTVTFSEVDSEGFLMLEKKRVFLANSRGGGGGGEVSLPYAII